MDGRHVLFTEVDGGGRFDRDTALGRIFHPGTVSYRGTTTNDSLHITVSPENRVAVHVDRLSPLAVRPGRPCRYSFLRAVVHNVVHVAEAIVLLCRRPLQHRCVLECEVVTAQASPQRVYEFSCKAAGAEGWRWRTLVTSEEDLVATVADHARRVHRVKTVSETIAACALGVARANGSRT